MKVVVDYSATWCGPCRFIAPKYAAFSVQYTNVIFAHVDIDELNTHPLVKEIQGVPTFQFYKGGSKVSEFSGKYPLPLPFLPRFLWCLIANVFKVQTKPL